MKSKDQKEQGAQPGVPEKNKEMIKEMAMLQRKLLSRGVCQLET